MFKTTLYTNGSHQYQEMTLTRGFQSSVAPRLHFGLGNAPKIDSIKVVWPDKKIQILHGLKINTLLTIDYAEAVAQNGRKNPLKSAQLFQKAEPAITVEHRHMENYYDDFNKEILLPHQMSMLGPNVAVGDLNHDGLDDFVVGGAPKSKAAVYFQKAKGFQKIEMDVLDTDSGHEDMGVHIFDADNDGDNDIYMVSGGNEFSPDSQMLQDRLYVNDGSGKFRKSDTALPSMITSGSRVHSFDFDKDGDLDLFVGGRLVPANYPAPANSYLLENVSQAGDPKFVDATPKLAPMLEKLGLVTDAVWTDFDADGWTDLIVVGEWMPITMLKNDQGYFTNVSEAYQLSESQGWWFSIKDGDFDNDGDMDYIVGNLGLNYKYKASKDETFDIYFNDFDNNSTNDIVLSYFNEGEKFPLRGRECSSQQMPGIKQKFKDYESFSQATLTDVYTESSLEESLHYQVKSFASIYLENKNGEFVVHELPKLAQLSSINQILVKDYTRDGNLDVLVAGNLHSSEVETPRNDAGNGLLLKGDGSGGFIPIEGHTSGFYAPGDVKDMESLYINEKEYIVVVKNSDFIQLLQVTP